MKTIGLCGGAGSGKSTLAKHLKEEYFFLSKSVTIIQLDDYYYTDDTHGVYITGKKDSKRFFDMNHPDSIDIVRVQNLIDKTDTNILILEGLFPLCIQSLAVQLDISIYVDVPADIRLGRKIVRKFEEKHTPPQVVFENYLDTVRNRHYKFIEPCKDIANLVVDGTLSTSEQVALCFNTIKNRSVE